MDYKTYLQSKTWQTKKELYKKSYCEICNSKKNLHLHHLKYHRVVLGKETEKDLATLCDNCHLASHIGTVSKTKLSKPSNATKNIVFRIRENRKLKLNVCAIFLRRKYIAMHGDYNTPQYQYFIKTIKKTGKQINDKWFYTIPKIEAGGSENVAVPR